MRTSNRTSDKIVLQTDEVRSFFDIKDPTGNSHFQYPAILSPKLAASMLDLSVSTIYKWLSKGYLKKCSRKRGKHVFILRDKLVKEIFTAPEEWKEE